jgi:hypothetical protein
MHKSFLGTTMLLLFARENRLSLHKQSLTEFSKMKSLIGTKICVSNPSGNFAIPTNIKKDPSVATTAA